MYRTFTISLNCVFNFLSIYFVHPWRLVIYQGLIYLVIEVKLAASTEPPGHFLSTNFRQQVSWVLLFNFCSHGLLDSQQFCRGNQKSKMKIFLLKSFLVKRIHFSFLIISSKLLRIQQTMRTKLKRRTQLTCCQKLVLRK